MVSGISIQEFKKLFFEFYGEKFIDGFELFQSPLNVVQYGDFKLYDNYADEDIYEELPILSTLFEKEDKVHLYTEHAYLGSDVFILKAGEIKEFLKDGCLDLDFFSNEPFFICLKTDKAFGYCLEGAELDSGMFFQLDLKNLRKNNRKKLIKEFVDILSGHLCEMKIESV